MCSTFSAAMWMTGAIVCVTLMTLGRARRQFDTLGFRLVAKAALGFNGVKDVGHPRIQLFAETTRP